MIIDWRYGAWDQTGLYDASAIGTWSTSEATIVTITDACNIELIAKPLEMTLTSKPLELTLKATC